MFEAQIAEGMKLLDEKEGPLWDQRIETDKLDMGRCSSCILGQLHGWYTDGLDEYELTEGSMWNAYEKHKAYVKSAYYYGFALPFNCPASATHEEREAIFQEDFKKYEILGAEWIAAIRRRREARIGR
jgi:hypothetical protein